MSSPLSKVDICNLALDHLNEASITNIDSPENKREALLARWYDLSRLSLLKLCSWNFAIRRANLAKLTDGPTFGNYTRYPLPNNYVRFLEIGEYGEVRHYKIEGNEILVSFLSSDDSVLNFKYVANVTNVAQFDPLFIETLALHIAMKICNKITNNASLLQNLTEMYKQALDQARMIDGQENPPQRIERSRFKEARTQNNRSRVASNYTIFDR